MTTIINVGGEDVPLIVGGAIFVAGILTHNTDATAIGASIAFGGKAVLHSSPPQQTSPPA